MNKLSFWKGLLKILKKYAYSFISLVLILGLGYVFLETSVGLRGVFWLAKKSLPGELRVDSLEGKLADHLTLRNFLYQNHTIKLSIANAEIHWKLSALIDKQLLINYLYLDKVNLIIKPSAEKAPSTWQMTWLNGVKIESMRLTQSTIIYDDYTLVLQGDLAKRWNLNGNLYTTLLKNQPSPQKNSPLLVARLTGERSHPELTLSFRQQTLVMQGWRARDVQATFKLLPTENTPWTLDLNMTTLENQTVLLHPIALHATGRLNPVSFQATLLPLTLMQQTKKDINVTLPETSLNFLTLSTGSRLNVQWKKSKYAELVATLLLPDYYPNRLPTEQQRISLQAQSTLHLSPALEEFSPWVKSLRGVLKINAQIHGNWKSPHLSANLLLQQASARVPSLNLFLNNVQGYARLNNATIQWLGRAQSGNGYLQLKGTTQLNPSTLPTTLLITGKNVTVSDTTNYKVIATPTLRLSANTSRIDVQGSVIVPRANLKLDDLESNTDLPSDVIFVDDKKKTHTLPIYAKIQLHLLQQVQFVYEHFKANVEGHLTLYDEPRHETRAFGQLNLTHGQYQDQDQVLKLQKNAYLLFSGNSIDNPTINVTVAKSIKVFSSAGDLYQSQTTNNPALESLEPSSLSDFTSLTKIKVGIQVQGPAKNPRVRLFSEPPTLDQQTILAYLLTGQANLISPQSLLGIASRFTGKNNGVTGLVKSLQKKTGLDQVTVQNYPIIDPLSGSLEQNTSLVLGKTLSPKLYVSYSFGIVKPINILQVSYLLNKYFSVQTTTSTYGNGVDLLFKGKR